MRKFIERSVTKGKDKWVLKPDEDMEYRIVRESGPSSRQYTSFSVEPSDKEGHYLAIGGCELEDGDGEILNQADQEGILTELLLPLLQEGQYPDAKSVAVGYPG